MPEPSTSRRRFLGALGGAAAAAVAGCAGSCAPSAPADASTDAAPADGWPVPGGDARNDGHRPDAATPSADPSTRHWDLYDLPDFEGGDRRHGVLSSPVVADGRVYVASGLPVPASSRDDRQGHLYALRADAADATVDWQVPLPEGGAGSPALVGDLVVVGAGDGGLRAFDAASGDPAWELSLGDAPGTPAPAGDHLYVGDAAGDVHAVEAASGESCWTVHLPSVLTRLLGPAHEARARPAATADGVYATAAVRDARNDRIGGGVLAGLAPDGSERWRYEFDAEAAPSAPAVVDGTVYVGAGPALHAVDAATGERRWRFVSGHDRTSRPAVVEDAVYVCSKNVYALDRATGEERWRYVNRYRQALGFTERKPMEAAPVVAGDAVLAGAGALDRATGERLWGEFGGQDDSEVFGSFTEGNVAREGPALADGRLYVAAAYGRVVVHGGEP